MRYYYCIVEGVHDAALMSRFLAMLGMRRVVRRPRIPEMFHPLIPTRYLIIGDNLDSEPSIPYFYTGQDRAVALRVAGGVFELFNTMDDDFFALRREDIRQLSGIAVFIDADATPAHETLERMAQSIDRRSDKKLEQEGERFCFDAGLLRGEGKVFDVPVRAQVYVFPDNHRPGVMEDLLLEAGGLVYPQLLGEARRYVDQSVRVNGEMFQAHQKKAVVGCVGNILHPGKANQITIARDQWIGKRTIRDCPDVRKLFAFCRQFFM